MQLYQLGENWAQNHPVLVGLLFFIVSTIISLYAGDLRRFLAVPPQRFRSRLLKSRLTSAEERLIALEKVHGNAEATVITIAKRFCSLFFIVARVSLFVIGYVLVARTIVTARFGMFVDGAIFGLFFGFITGEIASINRFLIDLENYGSASAKLRQRISSLRTQLEPTPKTAASASP